MGFVGIKDEKERASVILYLNQNSDNPKHYLNLSKQYTRYFFEHKFYLELLPNF